MEATHRYRLLIIFAAIVLCLSVCFANASEVSNGVKPPCTGAGLVFPTSQLHTTFMPVMALNYTPETSTLRERGTVSQGLLDQVTAGARKSHGFLHRTSFTRHKAGLILNRQQSSPYRLSSKSTQEESPVE